MKSNQTKTILITGGAGFIGSAVVRHIIRETDDRIVNVDKLTYAGNLLNLAGVSDSERYYFEQADIGDREKMVKIFDHYKPDMVMHLAAESHVDRSISGPAEFIETNIVGTYTLLEVTRAYLDKTSTERRNSFRFHHVSTDEVYGDLPHPDHHRPSSASDRENSDLPCFTEETPYKPSSPYSASKASSDHLVHAWHRTYGLPVVMSNCSNNYGPYQFPEKLIPLMISNALAGQPLPVYGQGQQIRDWLYVEDHARALNLVLHQGEIGETYNIGGHNERRNIEVVETVCDCLASLTNDSMENQYPTDFKSLITFVTDRPGHDQRYAIDASKIQRTLGWQPRETFESGIYKTVDWYLEHREWWQAMSPTMTRPNQVSL